jgi:hypothetical protein
MAARPPDVWIISQWFVTKIAAAISEAPTRIEIDVPMVHIMGRIRPGRHHE